MAVKRRYEDGCTAAHALNLVGERWALLVVRELLFGAKRFTDLRVGLPGASPNVLSQRLRELEEAGVLRRRRLPPPSAARVYELTPWGQDLGPIIGALGKWGARSAGLREDAPISAATMMLALQTLYDPARADGLVADVVVCLGDDCYRVAVAPDGVRVVRGPVDEPDAVIRTDTTTLSNVMGGRRALADARRSGDLAVQGDEVVAARFVTLFPFVEQTA